VNRITSKWGNCPQALRYNACGLFDFEEVFQFEY
jgi:hypothetical protein